MSDSEGSFHSANSTLPLDSPSSLEVEVAPLHSPLAARLARAKAAGIQGHLVLSDQQVTVGKTEKLALPQNRYWVVLRGKTGCAHAGFCSTFKVCKTHTFAGSKIDSRAVFHAFASLAEVRAYWADNSASEDLDLLTTCSACSLQCLS